MQTDALQGLARLVVLPGLHLAKRLHNQVALALEVCRQLPVSRRLVLHRPVGGQA